MCRRVISEIKLIQSVVPASPCGVSLMQTRSGNGHSGITRDGYGLGYDLTLHVVAMVGMSTRR